MDKIKQDDPGDFDLASNETPTRAVPERAAEPVWKKVLKLVVPALMATGIFGGIFGAYFQQRQWDHEKSVTKIQDDANRLLELEQQVGELIDQRGAAAGAIGIAINSHVSSEGWEHALGQYNKDYEDLARQLNKLAGRIAFFVDSPFIRETDGKPILMEDRREEISGNKDEIHINCLTYTLEFAKEKNIDPQSATHLLQIIDHCHELAKDDIAPLGGEKDSPVSCEQGQDRICDFNTRNGHIWWLNNVLRCTILDRAVTIRNVKTTWNLIPQIPSNYVLPEDARDCIKDYYHNDRFGHSPWPRYKMRLKALRNEAREKTSKTSRAERRT